jgi:hypothetical protein
MSFAVVDRRWGWLGRETRGEAEQREKHVEMHDGFGSRGGGLIARVVLKARVERDGYANGLWLGSRISQMREMLKRREVPVLYTS